MSAPHLAAAMKGRGFAFALAHIECDAVAPYLDPTHRINLPRGAVMMPMWVMDTPGKPVVVAVLGSQPAHDAPSVELPRTAFLSLVKAPDWNPA